MTGGRMRSGWVGWVGSVGCGLLALLAAGPAAAQSDDETTLDQARRLAVERSPALREAAARAHGGGAAVMESWGRLVPSVRLSAGLDRTGVLQRTVADPITGAIIALPDSLIEERRSFGTVARMSVDWTLFDGGQRALAIRRAGAEADALDLLLAAARARARAGATIAFLDAIEAAALTEVRRSEALRARSLLDAAETRFRTGAAPEIEALQASLALNEAELALEDALIAADAARAGLMEYIGEDMATTQLVAPPAPAPAAPLPDLERVASCAVAGSPELAALRARVEAAERNRSASRWSVLPTVGVGATFTRSEFGQAEDAITLDPRNAQVYYHLDLSWRPLEQPGAWLAERRRSDATLEEARATLDARRAAVARQAHTAVGRMRRAVVAEERGELNLRLAERQRVQASERYRLGLAPITETMQAEALVRAAERQAIEARFARLRAQAELEQATGVSHADCL